MEPINVQFDVNAVDCARRLIRNKGREAEETARRLADEADAVGEAAMRDNWLRIAEAVHQFGVSPSGRPRT